MPWGSAHRGKIINNLVLLQVDHVPIYKQTHTPQVDVLPLVHANYKWLYKHETKTVYTVERAHSYNNIM